MQDIEGLYILVQEIHHPQILLVLEQQNSPQFLGANNIATFTLPIQANISELSLYIPAGKTLSVLDTTTNAQMTDGNPVATFNVDDGGGNVVSYDKFTIDMGLTGFPSATTFLFTIS